MQLCMPQSSHINFWRNPQGNRSVRLTRVGCGRLDRREFMSPIIRNTRIQYSCLAFLLLAIAGTSIAQDGVSTAGAARTKFLSGLGMIPASREVIIEDFINYHRHEIGRPKAGEAVAMDVRWDRESVGSDGFAVLQIGLATSLAHDRQQLRPLNLSLVIDKSGSMAAANKLTRVKSALLTLVSQLRPIDTLSIVVFDSEAQVLLPAKRVSDRESIKGLISEIVPGSSTNINAGLMLGYQEAMKNYRKDSTNRVILLTDGIANQGVTDPKTIASASQGYNDRGIDLSTIGVGLDLNKDLLRDLAKSGRGLYHFVADAADVDKVFVKELQSLISPVATEPNLEIEFGPGLVLDKVYGYEPKLGERSIKVKLDNMNSGMTQVVLVRFTARAGTSDRSRLAVKARLAYYDLERKNTVETSQNSFVALTGDGQDGKKEDRSVAKNYAIAVLAQAIHDMAASCEGQKYRQAESKLYTAITSTSKQYPNLEDEDIKRTLTIAQKYREVLQKENETRGTNEDLRDRPVKRSLLNNIIANGDFALGNWGFDSDREYIKPSPNCLWGGYYTVVPAFNSPVHLHTNVPAHPFSAPGGGQVLFMNSGGSHLFTVWSAKVKCKPRTKYRVSFQEIGLSGGPEWVNSYEIRVNGDRSQPQLGGHSRYAEVFYEWDSGSSNSAEVSIVRLPNSHGGGVIGFANIEMIQVR